MATYVNNLRLTELATGEGSGTWGTTTNTSLELIGEALGFNTQDCFSSDADATTTVADGATDPARAFYFKVTSSATLTATRTLTIAPNTVSRVMFIENATTGSQSINISQGSGANVTIATGKTAVVYLDGAGSGAAVVDAMAGVDPGVTDTLAEVLAAGNTTGGTNILFGDSSGTSDDRLVFGAGSDLQIYHDGSHSYIQDAGTGNLNIQSNGVGVVIEHTDGTNLAVFNSGDGTANLYHSGSLKLATTSTGIDVTGVITTDGLTTSANINFGDNDKAVFGAGSDLEIFHDGTDSFISESNSSGSLFIKATHLYLQNSSGQDALNLINGNAFLKSGGSTKLETTSTGIDVTGTAVTDNLTVSGNSSFAGTFEISGASPKIFLSETDTTDVNTRMRNAAGKLQIQTVDNSDANPVNRLQIDHSTGDISFFEDTGTTAKLFFDASTESLGIGTSSPEHSLHVYDADSTTAGTMKIGGSAASLGLEIAYTQAGNTSASIFANPTYTNDDAVLKIGVDGDRNTNHLVLDGTGNVGIGTSSPTNLLDIVSTSNATARIEGGANGDASFKLTESGNSGFDFTYDGTNNNLKVGGGTSGSFTTHMTIQRDSGNVGIGSTSPTEPLTVSKTASGSTTQIVSLVNPVGAANTGVRLWMSGTNTTTRGTFIDAVAESTSNDHTLRFGTSAGSSAPAEHLRIDSSGNVLVNGTNATGKLVVDGDANAYTARFNSSTTTGQAFGARVRAGTNSSDFAVLVENTSATTMFAVRGDGNIGIGTSSPSSELHVKSTDGEVALNLEATTARLKVNGNNFISATSAVTTFGVNGTERLRIDSSGNVAIGNTSASAKLDIRQDSGSAIRCEDGSGGYFVVNQGGTVGIGTSSPSVALEVDGTIKASGNGKLQIADDTEGSTFEFNVGGSGALEILDGSTERLRVDSSGNVLVGKTSADNETQGVRIYPTGRQSIVSEADTALIINRRTSVGTVASFRKDATQVGTISVTASATAYNTSSDQRLKDNIVDAPSASADIDAIQVRSFDWKGDGLHQKYGMVAQELQSVAPEAVTGDADSDEMMSVDYSKLVPMMMKEIQSLRARVAQLEGEN